MQGSLTPEKYGLTQLADPNVKFCRRRQNWYKHTALFSAFAVDGPSFDDPHRNSHQATEHTTPLGHFGSTALQYSAQSILLTGSELAHCNNRF